MSTRPAATSLCRCPARTESRHPEPTAPHVVHARPAWVAHTQSRPPPERITSTLASLRKATNLPSGDYEPDAREELDGLLQLAVELTLPSCSVCVHADPDPPEQVFPNLVQKAVKFSPPRGPLTVSMVATAAPVTHLRP